MSVIRKDDIYHVKLELKDPNSDESGLYKCHITNKLGELNANLTLNIESNQFFFSSQIILNLFGFNALIIF